MFSKYYQCKCYSVFLLSISIILIKLPNFLVIYKKKFKHCFTRVYEKETEGENVYVQEEMHMHVL